MHSEGCEKMINLPVPQYDADEFYLRCARRTRDRDLRGALISEGDRVHLRADLYIEKAIEEELYTLERESAIHVTNEALGDLYNRVWVRGAERDCYDRIRNSSRFKRCPLCTQRDVQTLDHYLPESVFPEFAVFPLNLVPTCFSCNKAKLAHVPTGYDEQLFHPYFDDWGDYQFLTATIDVNSAVDASFSVSCPEEVDWQRFLRVQFHFQQLNLNELYSEHAALELVQKREVFAQTFASGGSQALKEELELEANARSVPFINSWQPALYRALSESDPFCSGGFLYIES